MKQIWVSKVGGPETLQLREGPDPLPRGGEVRIRVQACGVNFADILGRMGLFPGLPAGPFVPGYEVAGAIDAVGQGAGDLREGDAVLALTQRHGYSDVVCVPHRQVFKRLDWMSAEHGAALPVSYLTAFLSLMVFGSLRATDRVLIHLAGSGLGIAALDICRLLGAETFGTASAAKHPFLLERGLSHAIDYRHRDYELIIRELTNEQGVHIILDTLGGVHWKKNFRLLAPTGRLIYLGVSSMVPRQRRYWPAVLLGLLATPAYRPLQLLHSNRAIAGVNLANLWDSMEQMRGWMRQIVRWYDEALFRPHIDRVFRFTQVVDAHRYVQDRKNTGKVLLIP